MSLRPGRPGRFSRLGRKPVVVSGMGMFSVAGPVATRRVLMAAIAIDVVHVGVAMREHFGSRPRDVVTGMPVRRDV